MNRNIEFLSLSYVIHARTPHFEFFLKKMNKQVLPKPLDPRIVFCFRQTIASHDFTMPQSHSIQNLVHLDRHNFKEQTLSDTMHQTREFRIHQFLLISYEYSPPKCEKLVTFLYVCYATCRGQICYIPEIINLYEWNIEQWRRDIMCLRRLTKFISLYHIYECDERCV